MPANLHKDLSSCMEYYFNEPQPRWTQIPYSALEKAKCVRRLCEKFAEIQGYKDFKHFLHCMPQFLAPLNFLNFKNKVTYRLPMSHFCWPEMIRKVAWVWKQIFLFQPFFAVVFRPDSYSAAQTKRSFAESFCDSKHNRSHDCCASARTYSTASLFISESSPLVQTASS